MISINFDSIKKMYSAPKSINRKVLKAKPEQLYKPISNKAIANVLEQIKLHPGINQLRLCRRCGLTKVTVKRSLDRLLEKQEITRVAYGNAGKYTVYSYFEFGKETRIPTKNDLVREAVYNLLANEGELTSKHITTSLNLSTYRVQVAIASLQEQGKVTTTKRQGASGRLELMHKLAEVVDHVN